MSNLSLDDVVALNALIVTAIGLSLAFGRKDRKNGPLDLAGPRRQTALDELGTKVPVPKTRRANPSGSYGVAALQRLEEEEQTHGHRGRPPLEAVSSSRQMNVFFNWNGHTWDAYEVLGVPAGASRETVVAAFHAARSKSPDSIAFIQAAADAILKRR